MQVVEPETAVPLGDNSQEGHLLPLDEDHAFLQGVVKQNGENCYSFSGTLKRIRERNPPA